MEKVKSASQYTKEDWDTIKQGRENLKTELDEEKVKALQKLIKLHDSAKIRFDKETAYLNDLERRVLAARNIQELPRIQDNGERWRSLSDWQITFVCRD